MAEKLIRTVDIARSPAEVFAWHAKPGALQRLPPPWESVELVSATGGLEDGARVEMLSRVGPFKLRWIAEHYGYEVGVQFCDCSVVGPFARWEHCHRFEPLENGSCRLIDEIIYELPLAPLSGLVKGAVRNRLNRMFDYRHAVTKSDLATVSQNQKHVLVSGASGFIGQALTVFLQTQGWQVDRLVRREVNNRSEIRWSPLEGSVEWPENYHCDAVVHLAGANVAGGRWTKARKMEILNSRVRGTTTLVQALAQLEKPPEVFACGSATGFYGNTVDAATDETAPPGAGFLADVCVAWENAAQPIEELGTRLVQLRTGIVLSPEGGALGKMLPAFKVGLGGPMGDGQQWMGWIGLSDWLRACQFVLTHVELSGAINLTAPEPVRQKEFARILGDVISRSTIIPLPAPILRLALGQMADEALLASSRVLPGRLSESGFEFLHPSLEKALSYVLGRGISS